MILTKQKQPPKTTTNGITVIKRIDPYRKLTRSEKKKVKRLIKLAKFQHKIADSAQRTIPYREMARNGICQLGNNLYNRTIEFGDINYQLARNEDKSNVFNNWCSLFNSFDSTLSIQFSYINMPIDEEKYHKNISFELQDDDLDEYRQEYSEMIKERSSTTTKGLQKHRFLTFGMQSDSKEAAQQKLQRVEDELTQTIGHTLGASVSRCNGYQRLELLHDIYNLGTDRKLNFNWNFLADTGLSTKDFIAPNCFDFKAKSHFGLEKKVGRVSYLQIMASELSDGLLAELLDMDNPQIITLHLEPVDRTKSLKQVKNILSDILQMKITEQMKANRNGYDMDILPPDLVDSETEAQSLLDSLKDHDERMFLVTILATQFADSVQELEDRCFIANQIAQRYNCEFISLDWQQEAGLIASSPIGLNPVEIHRVLTTSATAILIPFKTQELCMENGHYYGINTISGNKILIDRKAADNMGGLILGKSGSGKGMASKHEIFNADLCSTDDILINDPEREYSPLVEKLGGMVIKLSPDSRHYINPMDINIHAQNEEDSDYDPIRVKSDFVLSFCEQAIGGKRGFEPKEKSILDRCVNLVYTEYLKDPRTDNMPILSDLYECLKKQPEPEALSIATSLELYVTGSLNVFNHQTNVDINNRIVCFDTKDIGKHLKAIALLVVQDQIWNRVTVNRMKGKFTRYYVDEFHLLLKNPETANAAIEMWKRFRKWGGMPTAITQQVSDLLLSPELEGIIANSSFFYLLNQSTTDTPLLAELLRISPSQMEKVTDVKPGRGLIKFMDTIVPFNDEIPEDSKMYKLMTTKLSDVVTQ